MLGDIEGCQLAPCALLLRLLLTLSVVIAALSRLRLPLYTRRQTVPRRSDMYPDSLGKLGLGEQQHPPHAHTYIRHVVARWRVLRRLL